MNRKALTITYVVKAFPCNYDEGYGNVSIAKKVHRGSGETYLFTSRQALRYSIVNWLVEQKVWKYAHLTSAEGVKQYNPEQLNEQFPEEADLFGYMITAGRGKAAKTRAAVAKLTHLISLEPWFGDQDLLTNKNFADRIQENPDMANIETGYGYYKYSLSVDLDKVGEDENFNHHLSKEEKIKRVCDLIEATKFLFRDIRGRREDLKPVFVVGGVYHKKSLFFHNAVNVDFKGSKPFIKQEGLNQVLEAKYEVDGKELKVGDFTLLGIQKGEFWDDLEIEKSSFDTLDQIKEEVKKSFNE
ncbi:MAG: type I-B CRISPR-associated protein Cas7/Cst2/DevR [Candidatus Omnitrophica bacterium]|nr:type I-B CRISPR-associated protein Cas7/Cst2/DevR [Candidatus Omnitrophota bacterium]